AQAYCPSPSGLTSVVVQRVVDGDSLRLSDGRSVRMIGLNTPELGKQGRSDEPLAVAARLRLQALVDASGGRVGLRPGKQVKDHYGRTLAHIY
ncbi:thermonuclease family protein, partial [Pseudomonas viridiflava]|uniref:thermonuclease family protein n=1 Tax=Pseudomonas viridiflava TaxID=33069 RepID=UPI003C6E951D